MTVSALFEERRFVEAIGPARRACEANPDNADAWRAYCVALKHAHDWRACLDACQRAIALAPDDCEGPRWNAGIAATALGDWPTARASWRGNGIELPDGDGPIAMRLGMCSLRVGEDGAEETVFAQRIDPCRARIESVPLPECGRRYGDVILHDGEPRGRRLVGSHEVAVFDELVRLERSAYETWRVTVDCADQAELDALLALFSDIDGMVEDWTSNLQLLCRQCSLGTPHDHHRPDDIAWKTRHDLGFALRDEKPLSRLRRLKLWWRKEVREVTRLT